LNAQGIRIGDSKKGSEKFKIKHSKKIKEKLQILPYQNKSLEDMEDEFWQEIPGFDGYLLLSSLPSLSLWRDSLKELMDQKVTGQKTKYFPHCSKNQKQFYRRFYLSLVL
jgi:hypothetical protein